jgi:hypothetical protein
MWCATTSIGGMYLGVLIGAITPYVSLALAFETFAFLAQPG